MHGKTKYGVVVPGLRGCEIQETLTLMSDQHQIPNRLTRRTLDGRSQEPLHSSSIGIRYEE